MQEDYINELESAVRREQETGIVDERTKHVRVRAGVYSMRGESGRYVVRLRVPAGVITPEQLEAVARFAESHGARPLVHLTTRQGIQIAGVKSGEAGGLLRKIEAAGLTTRFTGGNVVRNVVACPLSGLSPGSVFDVTPYALAVDKALKDDPRYQNLPRKIKIAFESCETDHVHTQVADIGCLARMEEGQKGFKVVVAGGMGAVPMRARLLEEFVPLHLLLPTLQAVLQVFDGYGNRSNRSQARLKWLLRARGIEWFREFTALERTRLAAAGGAIALAPVSVDEEPLPAVNASEVSSPAYAEWRRSNAVPQRQEGFCTVMVRCPLGDLSAAQLRTLATAAEKLSGVPLRLTIDQNVAVRWVRVETLPLLYSFLAGEQLHGCCAGEIPDVTRCVGAEACLSAITHPAGAAKAVGALFTNGFGREPALRGLRIRISGCQNACSHHPLADIGLAGAAKSCFGKMVPHYSLRLGGNSVPEEDAPLSRRLLDVPSYKVSDAVRRLLEIYVRGKEEGESLRAFAERSGIDRIRAELELFTTVPPPEEGPEFYRDLDAAADFRLNAKEGECHA